MNILKYINISGEMTNTFMDHYHYLVITVHKKNSCIF